MNDRPLPWYKLLTRYHWFVFIVAALGWLFDTMDQQLFNLARRPSMLELLPLTPGLNTASMTADQFKAVVGEYSGYATAIFLLGWATGGLTFGVLGDRFGRARVMMWTILAYSLCTGLSAFSTNFWDFAFYRFLTGLGVGGEFAVGVALVAEVMPEKARPFALGWLQALSAVGNISAALISMSLGHLEQTGVTGGSDDLRFQDDRLAIDVRRRHGARPALPGHSQQTERAGTLGEGEPRRRGEEGAESITPTCSAIRVGGRTHSSACSWRLPASSVCGASASSASTCCNSSSASTSKTKV